MNETSLTVGEAVVDLLQQYGIEYVFGIPGTHSIELYRGLSSSSIKHISPRHEQGAGFMADGYARTSGKAAACFVITGPGATNISTPIGEAYMDSVPMLVISPVNPPVEDEINRGRLHEITNQQKVTDPLCALSHTAENVEDIPQFIHKAFEIFERQNPRPVHLHIPLPLLVEPVTERWQKSDISGIRGIRDDEVRNCLQQINACKRPVLVAGGGAINYKQQVVKLAENIGCPLLTTVAGRGIAEPDHPLSAGAQLRAGHVQKIIEESDLVLFLGTDFGQTDHWNDDLKIPSNQIWVNIDPDVLEIQNATIRLLGDAGAFAEEMNNVLQPNQQRYDEAVAICEQLKSVHHAHMTEKEQRHWQVLESMQSIYPDVVITSDMTQIAYTAVDLLPMTDVRKWHHPTGYGTLGYALPAAIGACLAQKDTPVIAMVGDAGLQYTLQEMGLAKELNLNLTVLLWNNDALQQIYDDMENAEIEPVGVIQKNPDFEKLAEAYGWEYVAVKSLEELSQDLRRAIENQGPVLVQLNEDITIPS